MYTFFAFLSRMKFIQRWSLMRSTQNENIAEHSLQVAMIAHILAVIKNKLFGGNVSTERTVLMALYHEASEIITGDLPTPVKYSDKTIETAFKQLEELAAEKIISKLPEELQAELSEYILADKSTEEYRLVKAADKISALTKCLEELRSGNAEFRVAKTTIECDLKKISTPEVQYFLDNFVAAFERTLDEL